jgi:glycosyltransferase involved in cell wall biosynthesis
MHKGLKISVAMCTYNGALFIQEQLESIAAQTRLPDEVIVCDDGSSDGTLDVVAQFASCVPFLLNYHRNPNQLGVTKNFERAISLCTGDIIFLCDQDDVWLPQKIETMIAVFQANEQVGLVFSNGFITDSKLNRQGYTVWDTFCLGKKSLRALTGEDPLSFLIRHYAITGATMAFRANLKEKILPIPKVWIHDAWIACLAASQGSIATVVEPLILYRQHEGNVIGGRRLSLREKIIQTRKMTPDDIEIEVSQSLELLHKLQAMTGSKVTSHHLREIQNKIQHLSARREMFFRSFVGRIGIVMRELFKLAYFKFSRGFASVITDLILRIGAARKR